jgi:hypothetical protein
MRMGPMRERSEQLKRDLRADQDESTQWNDLKNHTPDRTEDVDRQGLRERALTGCVVRALSQPVPYLSVPLGT